jgi:hypothetical protein
MERDMQAPLTFDLFNKFGAFVMPSAEQIASLDSETQERFAAVQAAATKLETFKAQRRTPQAVTDALAERDASDAALRVLRPKVSAVANAKEWIASQRAE